VLLRYSIHLSRTRHDPGELGLVPCLLDLSSTHVAHL
jgi:hypothetical protein